MNAGVQAKILDISTDRSGGRRTAKHRAQVSAFSDEMIHFSTFEKVNKYWFA